MEPAKLMTEGNQLIAAVLEPAGFQPNPIESGVGSGGPFATTRWTRGDQAIELSFRTSVGIVFYRWGAEVYDDLAELLAPLLAGDTTDTLVLVREWHPVSKLP